MPWPYPFFEDYGHCSSHVYYMTGCPDCAVSNELILAQEENERLYKAQIIGVHPLEIHPGMSPKLQLMRQQLTRKIFVFLVTASADVVESIKKRYDKTSDLRDLFFASYATIEWKALVDEVKSDIAEAAKLGGIDAVGQLELKDYNPKVESFASSYSKGRSTEMIGKKIEDGKLVDNPSAKYVVSQTTEDDLEYLMTETSSDTLDQLVTKVQTAPIFSRKRAELIAVTELAMAQFLGHLNVWKSSGLIKTVNLIPSPAHAIEDECDDIFVAGPYPIEEAPQLPIHPRCQCGLEVIELTG